jgi:hypothetical protein
MKLGGVLTMLVLGSFLGVMWRREARQRRAAERVEAQRAAGARPPTGLSATPASLTEKSAGAGA